MKRLTFLLSLLPAVAMAHGGALATGAGEPGQLADVQRTVRIGMDDAMRYTPNVLTVRRGDTLRLLVSNHGAVMHEIVLGTSEEIEHHLRAMRSDPAMAHGAPYMAHVAPGEEAQLIWRFTQSGTMHYACLLPGHYEAGMTGTIAVR